MNASQRFLVAIIPFILLIFGVQGQTLRKICKLPSIVNETSGIEVTDKNKIWTFNDSGGKPSIYLCDTLGNLLKTISITGAWNRDWEDICQDAHGNFYIGNIGNNDNKQKDLTIFKIPNPDTITGNSVASEVIYYSYEDQNTFPPAASQLNFDCEALFWFDGNLYVCSKNRTVPFDGKTHLYRMPDKAGSYIAQKIATFDTKGTDMFNYWITAADISPDGSKFALLSSNKMWIFYDYVGDDFVNGKNTMIQFSSSTQKEAICFVNNEEVYITDEEWNFADTRNLYSVKLPSFSVTNLLESLIEDTIYCYPNPSSCLITVFTNKETTDYQLFSTSGALLLEGKGNTLDLSGLEESVYLLKSEGKVARIIKK